MQVGIISYILPFLQLSITSYSRFMGIGNWQKLKVKIQSVNLFYWWKSLFIRPLKELSFGSHSRQSNVVFYRRSEANWQKLVLKNGYFLCLKKIKMSAVIYYFQNLYFDCSGDWLVAWLLNCPLRTSILKYFLIFLLDG